MTEQSPHKSTRQWHIALLIGSQEPSETDALLVQALEKNGWRTTVLSLAKHRDRLGNSSSPLWEELRTGLTQFAQSLAGNFVGPIELPEWLQQSFQQEAKNVDAVLTQNPKVARLVYPSIEKIWPEALRIGLQGGYRSGEAWNSVVMEDFIVPHPAIAAPLQSLREGYTRMRVGGPLVRDVAPKERRLDEADHVIAVSFSGLDTGDIDPILFQLSLAQENDCTLLFLGTGTESIDELVRVKAAQYGLRAKRPRNTADNEAWIAGASILVGFPDHSELAQAVHRKVPCVIFANRHALPPGYRILADHGAILVSELAVTFAVDMESALPGGARHQSVCEALKALPTTGTEGITKAVMASLEDGRPTTRSIPAEGGDDELEDIGIPDTSRSIPQVIGPDMRRRYLTELILKQKQLDAQLEKTRNDLEAWSRRSKLAGDAGRAELVAAAEQRVQGLQRISGKLENERARLMGLRDRLAAGEPLTAEDQQSAAQILGAGAGFNVVRDDGDLAMFSKLEIDDALQRLKNKLDDLS